jgi:hypothetical protein
MSEILLVNPRRRRRKKKTTTRRRRRNPVANPRRRRRKTVAKRRSTRRRRNPRMTARTVQNQVMDGLQGAMGALALDVTLGYLPLPANLKAGLVGTGVKALLAIGIGVVGANLKVIKASTAKVWSNGALTVVLHDELKKQVQQFMPNIAMGEYLSINDTNMGYYGSGYNPGPVYLPELSMEDLSTQQDGFGEYMGAEYIDDFSY